MAIPESDGKAATGQVGLSINSASTLRIEAVEITLSMTHAMGTDVSLWLRAPDRTMVPIFDGDGASRTWTSGLTWSFEVDCLRGYSAQGTWAVVAEDNVTGNVGTLNDLQIRFYGSAATTNDVYNFTQDFQLMETCQSSRGVLGDTNGGTDTLNFASIEASITPNLAAGGAIGFAGTKVAGFATGADAFEKFYSGDGGNDSLVGGGGADVFIYATSTGVDTISGWEDNIDTLSLDDALWGTGKTIQQVLDSFAHVSGSNTVLTFAAVSITLLGVTNVNSLADDIVLT